MTKLLLALAMAGAALAEGPVYPHRWVWISRAVSTDRDVEEIRKIARTAADHGLNGIVLQAGLDRLSLQTEAYRERLRQVRRIAEELNLEIVPCIFSVGYGGSMLGFSRHFAEGVPVNDALFEVADGEARLVPDPPVAFDNGGLEEYDGHKARGYALQDGPGVYSFVDTETFAEGAASLRYENIGAAPNGNARLMQVVAVRPYRAYRVSLWAKTEELQGTLRLQTLSADAAARALAPWDAKMPATSGWRRLTWGFNSLDYDRVRIYAGVWAGRGGRFWLDGFEVEEVGPVNILRRDGTPFSLRADGGETEYEEGADFLPLLDRLLNFRFDHDAPAIRIRPEGRIREGDRLRASWYQGMSVNDGQVSVCMSEPRIYDIWRDEARRLHELLAPRRYLLSMDEVRMAGSCRACKERGIPLGRMLGETITRQMEILREINPDADIWAWSDMLDPNHNARPGFYYLADGDFHESWLHVPRDLGIVTWYYSRRVPSLEHFSSLGFRTLAGAYYDGDDLSNPRGWLEALDRVPHASGIMYTTWENKYNLLADFGDLVSQPR